MVRFDVSVGFVGYLLQAEEENIGVLSIRTCIVRFERRQAGIMYIIELCRIEG